MDITRLKKLAYGPKSHHPSYVSMMDSEDRKALRTLIEHYEYLLKSIQEAKDTTSEIF